MKIRNLKRSRNNSGIIFTLVVIVLVLGGLLLLGQSGNSQSATSLADLVGKPAPRFSFKDRLGNEYTNDNLKGKKVVLFFNEGIMCYPACWREMFALSDNPQLKSSDTVVLSVVVDSKADWDSAIAKMPELASAKIVFDEDRSSSKDFNVLTLPSSMHYGSLPGHTYVVIDKEGNVRYTFDDPRMAANGGLIAQELQKL